MQVRTCISIKAQMQVRTCAKRFIRIDNRVIWQYLLHAIVLPLSFYSNVSQPLWSCSTLEISECISDTHENMQ